MALLAKSSTLGRLCKRPLRNRTYRRRIKLVNFFRYWKIFKFLVLNIFSNRQVACIIKLITAVIYGFRNKLECLTLKTRLSWKGLPRTNTLADYGNLKLRP